MVVIPLFWHNFCNTPSFAFFDPSDGFFHFLPTNPTPHEKQGFHFIPPPAYIPPSLRDCAPPRQPTPRPSGATSPNLRQRPAGSIPASPAPPKKTTNHFNPKIHHFNPHFSTFFTIFPLFWNHLKKISVSLPNFTHNQHLIDNK